VRAVSIVRFMGASSAEERAAAWSPSEDSAGFVVCR
jgi:hypothetical protein